MQIVRVVPNQPAPDKVMLAIRISRAMKVRIEKAAKDHKMSITQFVDWCLQTATKHVTLTSDDHRRIAKEIEEALSGTTTDQRLRASRVAREASKAGGV